MTLRKWLLRFEPSLYAALGVCWLAAGHPGMGGFYLFVGGVGVALDVVLLLSRGRP